MKSMLKNKIIKAGIWNFTGTFLLKAIVFLSVPIFTRIMNQSDYGIVATYTTYVTFLGIIIGLCLNTATANARIDFPKRFADYNANILMFSTIIFFIELFIANLILPIISGLLYLNRLYLNIIFFIAYSEYIVNTYYKINIIDFRFKENLKISVSNAVISLMLSIVFVFLCSNMIIGKLIGQSVFLFFSSIVIYYFVAIKQFHFFLFTDVKYAMKISIPNIVHQISQVIMRQSDKVIILNLCGSVMAAKYSVIYTLGLVMQMVWNALNEVWVPWLYRKLHAKDTTLIVKLSNIYLYFYTVITMLAILIIPDFLHIIVPATYLNAKDLVIPVLLGTYFMFLYSFFANIEIYYKKNSHMAIATFSAALVNIISNFIFIPIFGYKAAAYTTLMSYVLLSILHYLFLTYKFKLNIYTLNMFLIPVISVIAISIISFYLLDMLLIRLLFVLLIISLTTIYFLYNKFSIRELIELIKE